jgi:SAM-dependent methyltransferase
VEAVPVRRIADAWAVDRETCFGRRADPQAWLDLATRAIGADVVRFDRCPRCGLEMSSPRRPWLEEIYPEDETYPLRWEFGRCLDDLGPAPLGILELGCGSGEFLAMARDRGHQALGIDFNPAAVRQAGGRGLKAVCGGFGELRDRLLAEGTAMTFDAVATFHVIEHLADPGAVLRDLEPFVRPGTRLVISCPGPRRFTRLIGEQRLGTREFVDYPPHHVLRWTLPALRSFLEARGWKVLLELEEPLSWVGASSQMAIARALYRGYAHKAWRRRLGIAWARVRLLFEALRRPTSGLSVYALAERTGGPPEP